MWWIKRNLLTPSNPLGGRSVVSSLLKRSTSFSSAPSEKTPPIGELLRQEGVYSTDLAQIQRRVKEGALEHLAQRPGRSKKSVSEGEYAALKPPRGAYSRSRGCPVYLDLLLDGYFKRYFHWYNEEHLHFQH